MVIAADGRATGDAHLGDAHAGKAVAQLRGFAGRQGEVVFRQGQAEGEDQLREQRVADRVLGLEAARLRPQPRERDGEARAPERFLQGRDVGVETQRVLDRIGQAEQRDRAIGRGDVRRKAIEILTERISGPKKKNEKADKADKAERKETQT